MLEFLKHITPKIRFLILALFFILIPGTIISYLSLNSIRQKADNQSIKYHGTANLVRDKLESELFKLETSFRNKFVDSILFIESETELQTLLQSMDLAYPGFEKLCLLGKNGALIASLLTYGKNSPRRPELFIVGELKNILHQAENKEFIENNYTGAIDLYREADQVGLSLQEKAIVFARIGRNYYKSGHFEKGILEYLKILELANASTPIGNIPASIVALYQIAEGYQKLNALNDRNNILLELYYQLLTHPWDLKGDEYLYYLKSTIHEIREMESSSSISNNEAAIVDEMKRLEKRVIDQSRYIHQIEEEILGELMSDLNHLTSSEIQNKSFRTGMDSALALSYFILPPSMKQPQFIALAFRFDEDYLLTELFPQVLSAVELGKDLIVGILNEKDSLLYIQNNLQIPEYLVAENFTQFFSLWKVALFERTGKSIEQLAGREKRLYLLLFSGILLVMLIGIIVLARAVIHETEVSRLKQEFVSNVTHELKTPLSLIRMFGETLDSGIVTEEKKRREFYSIIRKESERLTHLINNVLDFSNIDSGKKEYNYEEVDLVSVIKPSLEAYKFHMRDRGFEFESKMPKEPMMTRIDKDAISQAFLNLLSNAVKYSEERKHIEIEISHDVQSAIISVSDQGVGIAKEDLKKIFEKFYRAPNHMEKQPRGSGLGLTLTMHIVDAHKGTIEVVSEPGVGSTFTIRLPFS